MTWSGIPRYGLKARAASDLIGRLDAIGFNARRLAAMGHQAWAPVADLAGQMGDAELAGSMSWVERNPGSTWRRGLVASDRAGVAVPAASALA